MNVSLIVWESLIGGAERFAVALAAEIRALGVNASLVFVGRQNQLRWDLDRTGVPWQLLGLSRGAHVLRHPRLLASAVTAGGADVAIAGSFGYLGLALRLGGFRGVLVGIEHGAVIRATDRLTPATAIRRLDRASGVPVHDAEIVISAFMEGIVRRGPHGRHLVRIPHGVRIPVAPMRLPVLGPAEPLRIGYAGRLLPGKGVDVLISSIGLVRDHGLERPILLRIAGDGPLRQDLERQVHNLALGHAVEFIGWTDELAAFWSECHIAVAPNDAFAESFCLSIVEAMSFARATVVTNLGALPELVEEGETGTVVEAGDPRPLATAIIRYAKRPDLVARHGSAAWERARQEYDLRRCATDYINLAGHHLTRRGRTARLSRRT